MSNDGGRPTTAVMTDAAANRPASAASASVRLIPDLDARRGGDVRCRNGKLAFTVPMSSTSRTPAWQTPGGPVSPNRLRVLAPGPLTTRAGSGPTRTLLRRLPVYAESWWRAGLTAACAAHAGLGPASLVLYDVSTLYFETDTGDGFREPGFSKERRLDPQITIGLLTDAAGFPLVVNAFEGNKAEPTTMLPTIRSFMTAASPTCLT
jgi:hypothetical protein